MSISAMKQALEVIEAAIESGDWQIDGACDPSMAIHSLYEAIAEAEKQEPALWFIQYKNRHEILWSKPKWVQEGVLEIKPFYTAPVHASDISQERVDETAKDKHEFECPRCGHCCKEWVGLDGDIPGLGLVTEEFYNGMLCAEDILRKKNT